jgi:hypothetical protein
MIHCHCQWITDPLPEAKNITNFQNRSRHRRGNSKRKVPTQLRNGVPTHYFITFWSRRENFLGTISWHAPAKESWWLTKILKIVISGNSLGLRNLFFFCFKFESCDCLYAGHWRLTWSLTSGPVGLVEVHAN